MKIIKEPKLTTYQKVCDRCGCEFEYNVQDVKCIQCYDYCYDCCKAQSYTKKIIECPFCRKSFDVERNVNEEYLNIFIRNS